MAHTKEQPYGVAHPQGEGQRQPRQPQGGPLPPVPARPHGQGEQGNSHGAKAHQGVEGGPSRGQRRYGLGGTQGRGIGHAAVIVGPVLRLNQQLRPAGQGKGDGQVPHQRAVVGGKFPGLSHKGSIHIHLAGGKDLRQPERGGDRLLRPLQDQTVAGLTVRGGVPVKD